MTKIKMNHSPRKSHSAKKIRLPVIVPAFLLVTVLFFSLASYSCLELEKHMNKETLSDIGKFQKNFQKFLSSDAELLGGLLHFFGENSELQKAFLAQNRKELIEHSKEVFEKIKADYNITHFYFIGEDQICFLRAHNPKRFGDTIKRFTLKQAVATGQPAYGIELGVLGTFTLRMVQPWRIDGKIVGYIELGKEIEYLTSQLSNLLDVGLVFTIFKSHLNRQSWDEGLRMMGTEANWNEFDSFVVTSRSSSSFSERLNQVASDNLSKQSLYLFEDERDESQWQAGSTALIDAGNQQVGNVFIFRNVSPEVNLLNQLKVGMLLILVSIGGIMFFFYWRYVKSLEADLISLYESLDAEIIQRKKMALQYHELSLQYQLILNSAGEGIYGLDLEGNTTFINIAGAKMLGYTIEELTGKHLHSMVHYKTIDGAEYSWDQCPVNKIMRSGGIFSAASEYFWTKDQKPIPIEYLVHPIKENNTIKGAVVLFKDISSRLEKEKQLKQAEQQVQQVEKLAGIGRLADGVAHEVLNPLNIISMHVQMLLKKTDQEMEKKPLLKIKNEVKRIGNIISSLSFYSEKESVTIKNVSAHVLLEEILVKLAPDIKSHSIEIKKNFEPNVPNMDWDAHEMKEAFFAILRNAVEAIQGPGSIEIKTSLLHRGGSDYLKIIFSDSGLGISKEDQKKLFDPFFSTKKDIYGVGMGLPICLSFVENNKGTISIDSELGIGTTVTFEFLVQKS